MSDAELDLYERELRAYAQQVGVDFDDVLAGAALHFASPRPPVRKPQTLTAAELAVLVQDDLDYARDAGTNP